MTQNVLIAGLLSVIGAVSALAHPSAEHKLEILDERIRERPEDQRLYIQRGAAYSNEGRYELALADFRKAETLGEPFVVAFDLGVLRYRQGMFAESRAYFDTFLKHFPNDPTALEHRARLLRDAGEHEASLADFRAYFAVQKHPNPGDYLSAARMLAEREGEGIGPAIGMLDEGMARLGVIPQLQRYAIELELERGNTAGAIDRLESLKPALGDSPEWKVEMGELLLRADRAAEARQYFSEASAQLGSLRSTPARQRVQKRLRELYPERIGTPSGHSRSDNP